MGYTAQWVILLSFLTALALNSRLNEGVNPFFFGLALFLVNLVLIIMALVMGGRHVRKEYQRLQWRRVLTTSENAIMQRVMSKNASSPSINALKASLDKDGTASGAAGGSGSGRRKAGSSENQKAARRASAAPGLDGSMRSLLGHYLLAPRDVVFERLLGSGSFGEVRAAHTCPPAHAKSR